MNATPIIDKLGYCAYCHIEVADWPEVNGRPILKWRPTRRESLFKMSNGSIMHVTLCNECDERVERKNFNILMHSIIGGWEDELMRSKMNDKQKEDYRDKFYSITIEEKI